MLLLPQRANDTHSPDHSPFLLYPPLCATVLPALQPAPVRCGHAAPRLPFCLPTVYGLFAGHTVLPIVAGSPAYLPGHLAYRHGFIAAMPVPGRSSAHYLPSGL